MSYQPIKLSPISAAGKSTVEQAGWRIAETYSTVEAEAAAVRRSAGVADLSALGKALIQGAEALPALVSVFGGAPQQTGGVAQAGDGLLACLARDEWYLTTAVGGEAQALQRLQAALTASGGIAHATDLTHGNAAVLLAGPRSPDVLPKVCGLDFHASVFPNRTVKQSSVARLHTLILRDDLAGVPAYQLHVSRSEADYLWGVLLDAASEFDAQPVGAAALAALRTSHGN